MLGQSISMLLPEVIGYKLVGKLGPLVTSTDLVLTITKHLRQLGVVGKFVEFYGPGVVELSIADRATISNMCPEYGATVGYFPIDENALNYLKQTSKITRQLKQLKQIQIIVKIKLILNKNSIILDRSEKKIDIIRKYLMATRQMRDYAKDEQNPRFTHSVTLDLATVVTSMSGPKRPHDRVSVSDMMADFQNCLVNPVSILKVV